MEDFTLIWHDAKKEMPDNYRTVIAVNCYNHFAVAIFQKKNKRDKGRWFFRQGFYSYNTSYAVGSYDENFRQHETVTYWAYLPKMVKSLYFDEEGE